ncbi:MAG: ParB N-terminal domain-containing protein [Bacteroidales bacterium]
MNIDINSLKEHPLNKEIYGDDDMDQLNELVQKIKESGWIKPIIVTKFDYVILSGHRRYRAALQLGMKEIEVEIYSGEEGKELELLLNENAFRHKTTMQRVAEGEYYRKIEESKAKERQFLGTELSANEHGGRTNEIIGERIGMSARSYHDARKVVQMIDEEDDPEVREFLGETLNTSVHAASKLIDKSDEFIEMVMDRASGDTKNVSTIVRELEKVNHGNNTHLPHGKPFQVIYIDLTVPFENDPSNLPLGSLAANDSVLFLWTLPEDLEIALNHVKKWGFKYRSCMIWNTDVFNEVGFYGQLLLIATKGKIKIITESQGKNTGIMKPLSIRSLIETNYYGDKLEILPEGWQIWATEEPF